MTSNMEPKIAIAHDYITQRGGAERVVLALARAFPDAPIYTTLYNPETTYPEFAGHRIITSPLNRVSILRNRHRLALPFLAWASNRMKVDADVVIASSSGWAHGFPSEGAKLVYCHSPARWLYLMDNYLGGDAHKSLSGIMLLGLKPFLLRWDKKAAKTSDLYVANAHVIKDRIRAAYGFDVEVIPPPFGLATSGENVPLVGVEDWAAEGFYLLVSRLLPYKNVGEAIDAFRSKSDRLIIIGAGPLAETLRQNLPSNVAIFSNIEDAQLRWAYSNCVGVVAPSYEDFGLTPLEGASFGKPVAAFRAGGYLDTVVEGVNGVFFEQPTPEQIAAGVDKLKETKWDVDAIRSHADNFSEEKFARRISRCVDHLWTATKQRQG